MGFFDLAGGVVWLVTGVAGVRWFEYSTSKAPGEPVSQLFRPVLPGEPEPEDVC